MSAEREKKKSGRSCHGEMAGNMLTDRDLLLTPAGSCQNRVSIWLPLPYHLTGAGRCGQTWQQS